MHDLRKEGGRTCFTDHYHYGNGSGATKASAQRDAIGSWQSFTDFEYGSDWARFLEGREQGNHLLERLERRRLPGSGTSLQITLLSYRNLIGPDGVKPAGLLFDPHPSPRDQKYILHSERCAWVATLRLFWHGPRASLVQEGRGAVGTGSVGHVGFHQDRMPERDRQGWLRSRLCFAFEIIIWAMKGAPGATGGAVMFRETVHKGTE